MSSGIYQIVCKTTGKIYVGRSVNIHLRWKQHKEKLDSGTHHNKYLQSSWAKYGSENFEFCIRLLCEKQYCKTEEQKILDALFDTGILFNLSRLASGGRGIQSPEDHEKRSLQMKARWARMKENGWTISEAHKAQLREAVKLAIHTPESRKSAGEKLSALKKGIKKNEKMKEATREKISKSNKGKIRTQQQRKNISNAHKGRKASLETKEKMSKSASGRKRSKETQEKIWETLKRKKEEKKIHDQ